MPVFSSRNAVYLRQIARASVFSRGNIQATLTIVRNGQVDVETLSSGLEEFLQRFGRRRRIGFRNLEQQSIGENAGGARDGKLPFCQQLRIDRKLAKSPRTKLERLQAKIERILDEAILHLKMLRSQERALGPQNWFQLLHRIAARPPRSGLEETLRRFSARLPTITIPEPGSKGQIGWDNWLGPNVGKRSRSIRSKRSLSPGAECDRKSEEDYSSRVAVGLPQAFHELQPFLGSGLQCLAAICCGKKPPDQNHRGRGEEPIESPHARLPGETPSLSKACSNSNMSGAAAIRLALAVWIHIRFNGSHRLSGAIDHSRPLLRINAPHARR